MLSEIGSITTCIPQLIGTVRLSLALLDVVPASALLGRCCSVKMTVCPGCRIRLSEDKQRKRLFFEQ